MSAIVDPASDNAVQAGGLNSATKAEQELLAEADYFYSVEHWEATHDDFGTLADEIDLGWSARGHIVEIGRLVALPSAYAVAIPCGFSDGEPDDWETTLFPSRAEAEAAYRKALADGAGNGTASTTDAGQAPGITK